MGPRVALMGAAIALAAANTGNNLLYLMLSLLMALAAVCIASARWSLRRMVVSARFPGEAVRGEAFLLAAEARGRFPLLPLTWVDVRLEGLPASVSLAVPISYAAGRGVAVRLVTPARRGVFERIVMTAATGYPLGLFGHRVRREYPGGLVVMPRFSRLRALRIRGIPAGRGQRGAAKAVGAPIGGAGDEHDNIRDYLPIDDARHIDWRSSARSGKLMVREFTRERERGIDLVLDPQAEDPEAFERMVERCAAILDYARRERIAARLLAPGLLEPLAGRAAMRFLAGVEPSRNLDLGARVEKTVARARSGSDVVVLSCDPRRATLIEVS